VDVDRLKSDLKRYEGSVKNRSGRHVVYDDADGKAIKPGKVCRGYPTVGYGRNLAGNGLSEDEAVFLLSNDIDRVAEQMDRRINWWRELSATRQSALLNMAFNLGISGLLGFPKMLGALKRGDYTTAASESLDSDWARQVGRRRSMGIADMLRYG